MSKRIEHILDVLKIIRQQYGNHPNIKDARNQALSKVATQSNVIRNTILDTITRQLSPQIIKVEQFDKYAEDWIKGKFKILKQILLAHSVDENDKSTINIFFATRIDLAEVLDEELEFQFPNQFYREGKQNLIMHLQRERNKSLIKTAKSVWRKFGNIKCAICSFSFFETYGDLGLDFIEAHHLTPISHLSEETSTTVDDLAPVCANCHRMIHKMRPWKTIEQMRRLVAKGII